jgi:hypothetical protein
MPHHTRSLGPPIEPWGNVVTIQEPPNGMHIREMVADRIDQARSQGGTRESVTIEWRGQPCHIDVVPMPIADLYYNPETHRIRAQRDHDLAKDKGLTSDPWSDESQEYLHYLLTADPADPGRRDVNFDNLMDDLRLYEQKDPGIITPSGILVNGNTRHAALRELGRENIRVGVLPGDWTWPDIRAVELELQLRKEHRRDYSYINQLIAIEDEAARGLPEAEICKKFRIQSKTFRQARLSGMRSGGARSSSQTVLWRVCASLTSRITRRSSRSCRESTLNSNREIMKALSA